MAQRASNRSGAAGPRAEAGGTILARNADRGVKVLAADEAAGAERLPQVRRIDVVLRLLHRRGRGERLEPRQRLAGQGMNPPRLQVAPGGRALRLLQDL